MEPLILHIVTSKFLNYARKLALSASRHVNVIQVVSVKKRVVCDTHCVPAVFFRHFCRVRKDQVVYQLTKNGFFCCQSQKVHGPELAAMNISFPCP